MIFRFSLYGFLKNLRLFEAFLLLALLERGNDFFAIGGLIAAREIALNVFEIPSGMIADAVGRRRCMVFSMACYIVSFLMLWKVGTYPLLMVAMIFYGLGDAFRSGTHKALIYSWLRQNGRESERTKVYGYTRSWSKMGSAVSAILAGIVVFFADNYSSVFLWSVLPAAINLVNLATYPTSLDDETAKPQSLAAAWAFVRDGMKDTLGRKSLRQLIVDSAAMEGTYAVAKDYLQPVVQHAAIGLPFLMAATGQQRTAVLGGAAYAVLFLLTSIASRQAHRWEQIHRGTEAAIGRLYLMSFACYVLLAVGLMVRWSWLVIGVFMVLGFMQNLWRPIHVGRFDRDGTSQLGATALSVESQAKAVAAALLAPPIGAMIDHLAKGADPTPLTALLPVVGVTLLVVAGWILQTRRRQAESADGPQVEDRSDMPPA